MLVHFLYFLLGIVFTAVVGTAIDYFFPHVALKARQDGCDKFEQYLLDNHPDLM